jgi:hypothetical protein
VVRSFCPGRDVALDFLFLVIASLNAVYQIGKATDAKGNVIEPAVEYEGLWLVYAFLHLFDKPDSS